MSEAKKPVTPRKQPRQARSKQTVEWVLEAAARVFKAEGFSATTNRIAELAGVSVGTLYEYFPNKEALLAALAERHVAEAERGIEAALAARTETPEFLQQLQQATLASHRYPSQALDFVSDATLAARLRERVSLLRAHMLSTLAGRATANGHADAEVRARIVFGLIAEQTSRTAYEMPSDKHEELAAQLLALASSHIAKR